jgi:mannose-6-phosphate isomerase-like protein (cupin superfamily)
MMIKFKSKLPDAIAPDGSEVRILAACKNGSMAEFTLPVGTISKAVAHNTVQEVWCVLSGQGEIWMKSPTTEHIFKLETGASLAIEVGTHFQFRNTGNEPLKVIATTMPPWPGPKEAYFVKGAW